jgi:hypothetical protein
MLNLSEIKAEVDRRTVLIGASGFVLPTYGRTEDFARPHIEADSRGYHYVVVERGRELERITTRELDELLYHIFQSITFSLAMDFECKHRIAREDCRRQIFCHQVELLSRLDRRWAARCAQEQNRVLEENPFRD